MLTAIKLVKDSSNHLNKMRKISNLGSLSTFAKSTKRTFATAIPPKKVPIPRTNNTPPLTQEFPGKTSTSNSPFNL